MPEPVSPIRPSLLAGLAALAGAVVSVSAFEGPFLFDDVPLIAGNHYVHGLEHWRRWWFEALWSTNYDVSVQHRSFWRPLVVASYALDWWWGRGSPFAFHLTNAAIHAANAALVFYLLRGWVRAALPALGGALAFAVHPVQTESVAWISGRTDSLAALGLLIATLGVRVTRRRRVAGIALQALGVLLAFSSKEMAVVLPVLVGIELWSERPTPPDLSRLIEILKRSAPHLALSLAFVLAHRFLDASGPSAASPPWSLRSALVLEAYARYAALLAWPDDLTLGRALLRHAEGVIQPHVEYAVSGGLGLALAAGAVYRYRARAPRLALGMVAALALALPASGVVWLGYAVLVSPRFLYIPMIAIALLVAAFLASRAGAHRVCRLACALLLASWTLRSMVRAGDFASADAFWRRELVHNPGYAPAHEYFISRELQAGRPRTALELARRALSLHAREGAAEGEQRAALMLKAVGAVLASTPDLEHATLRAVELFAQGAIAGTTARLALPHVGLDIDLAREQRSRAALAREERTLRVMAAEAAQRRGDDASARRNIEQALAGCNECWTLLSTSALILARAGQLDRALLLAERARAYSGSARLEGLAELIRSAQRWRTQLGAGASPVALAGFHSVLGSFGRAYAAARPAFADPPEQPDAVLSLARLAFQAGDTDTSRRLLTSIFSEPTVQASLDRFAANAPWLDRPRGPDDWLPSEPG